MCLCWLGSIKNKQKKTIVVKRSVNSTNLFILHINGRLELFTHNWTKHLWSVHSFQGMLGPV